MGKLNKISIVLLIVGILGLILRQTPLSNVLISTGRISWSTFETAKFTLPDCIAAFGFGSCVGLWVINFKNK